VRLLPWKVIRECIEIVDSIQDTSVEIIHSRKIALEAGKEAMDREVGQGKDMMSILCMLHPTSSFL
jgi:hypothetical protein